MCLALSVCGCECVCACIRACVHVCVHACMCVYVCMRACVCMCVCGVPPRAARYLTKMLRVVKKDQITLHVHKHII